MKIGIDISQIVHEGTGVGEYMRSLVKALLQLDHENEYILFGASLRKLSRFTEYFEEVRVLNPRVRLVKIPIPPMILELLWNTLHTIPIEWLTGSVDVFWSSDWTQPPLRRARGITTIHDLTVLRYPESFGGTNIVEVAKRRLTWAKKECRHFLCDSQATARDAKGLLGIGNCTTVYPGL
ncbi:glycosyltransferase [Candidatus Gottesmanbacteria bacterium]|nr:glycosyltransferase [Candidatus Gottesmanbacteria bacterium]